MLRRARYCYGKLSVCPCVRNVEVLWSHRLEIFKNKPGMFALCNPNVAGLLYLIYGSKISFFFWLRVLDKAEYSAFQSTLNSPIVSYRIALSTVPISTSLNDFERLLMLSVWPVLKILTVPFLLTYFILLTSSTLFIFIIECNCKTNNINEN